MGNKAGMGLDERQRPLEMPRTRSNGGAPHDWEVSLSRKGLG